MSRQGFSKNGLLNAAIVACERCPRLIDHCRRVALEKRRAYRDQDYWGKPVPGLGDPRAAVLMVGLAPPPTAPTAPAACSPATARATS